jgi:hypothetical protein
MPTQASIWKNMTPKEKLELFIATIRQARELKRIGIRLRNPQATSEQIEKELARIWLHARP